MMDYTIKIGGEAGQGIQTVGDTLSHIFAHAGYHVFTHQDYESRIRGGHNFYQIRISDKPVTASRSKVDIIVALDKESIIEHEKELSPQGHVLYDSTFIKKKYDKPNFLDFPLFELAQTHGGSKIMANTVAVGAVIGMLGMNPEIMYEIVKKTFKKKGQQFNPLTMAIALNCSFVARAFAGDIDHLKYIIKEAVNHKGFAVVDILQPCVSFNKINTFEWYRQRIYKLEKGYDPTDRIRAFEKSLEWGDRIPLGVIYKTERLTTMLPVKIGFFIE